MATNLTVNGVTYAFPQTGNQNWGDAVTGWATAVTSGMLQKAGGTFTLTADANFGSSFGLIAGYFTSAGTNPSATGVVRLASGEAVAFRNNANNADLLLTTDSSDNLLFNGHIIDSSSGLVPVTGGGTGLSSYTTGDTLYASGATTLSKLAIGAANKVMTSTGSAPAWNLLVNANIDAAAAIAYSKLSLTGSILNADINASAAIAYSKLNLSGSILNADVNASAAIAYSKLALSASIVNADINSSAAIAYSKLALTGNIVNADINSSAAIAYSKLNLTGSIVSADISGSISAAKGGTGQTSYTTGDLLYASGASAISKLAIGSTGQILKVAGGLPSWATLAVTLSVVSKTSNYTLTGSDDQVIADTSGGAFALTMPAASSNSGKVFYIKLKTAGNILTISRSGSDTFDGVTSLKMGTAGDYLILVSDGVSIWTIQDYGVNNSALIETTQGTSFSSNGTIINFDSPVSDPLGQFTTGASSKFTAQIPGLYQVTCGFNLQATRAASANSQYTQVQVFKNGSQFEGFPKVLNWNTTSTDNLGVGGSTFVRLAATDTVDIRTFSTLGTTNGNLDGVAANNWMNVVRVSN